jgi:ubiquinone biosynthesis protein
VVDHLDEITRDGLVLAPETVTAISDAEARRSRLLTAGVWAIVLLLAWLVWLII